MVNEIVFFEPVFAALGVQVVRMPLPLVGSVGIESGRGLGAVEGPAPVLTGGGLSLVSPVVLVRPARWGMVVCSWKRPAMRSVINRAALMMGRPAGLETRCPLRPVEGFMPTRSGAGWFRSLRVGRTTRVVSINRSFLTETMPVPARRVPAVIFRQGAFVLEGRMGRGQGNPEPRRFDRYGFLRKAHEF